MDTNSNSHSNLENQKTPKDIKEIEFQVIALVKDFISEFKSERMIHGITLDSSLDTDLGIDSLGRVELFLRIEKAFSVSVPETMMIKIDRISDIVQFLMQASPETESSYIADQSSQAHLQEQARASRFDPSSAKSLLEVMVEHAQQEPKRPHIYLQNEKGQETLITYGDLYQNSKKVAAGLLNLELKPGETVAIMLPTSPDFFYAFFGVMLAGGIPVPIYPPFRPDKLEEYALREATILNNAEAKVLITFSQVETLGKILRVFIKSLTEVTTVPLLMTKGEKFSNFVPAVNYSYDDAAMIQYTSGSTSDPKGVLLSHYNLLSNIRESGKTIQMSAKDIGVSWLPLYHDMGLIGAWFSSLYYGFPLIMMSPLTFLSHPERWLWAIHYHRGTLSAGPNFAYELCVRKIQDHNIQGLDLSSWRLAFNGAEAINPRTMERFIKKFEPYGFRPETFFPVYGLAESTVALTFPPMYRKPKIDLIEKEAFEKSHRAERALVDSASGNSKRDTYEFVSCGMALENHEIRIVDAKGEELPERHVGSLQFTGPSSMQGYYHNPQATQAIYQEGWLDSGDFAYIADGEVYITGRKKDIIIKAGRNLYPQEIEEVASQVNGIRKGCVVAFGVSDPKWGTESLIIVAETAETESNEKSKIIANVIEKVALVLGLPPDQVFLVAPRSIPKTSSGKLQRSACKQLFLEGKLSRGGRPIWMQISKLMLMGGKVTLFRNFSKIGGIIYNIYAYFWFSILLLPTLMSVFLFPKNIALVLSKAFLRLFLFLIACPLKIEGKENLYSHKNMIFVSNHASYVDSFYLMSILPNNTLFVGKKELLNWPVVKYLIKKFGFLTVDRLDFSKSLADTDAINQALKSGNSVLIYPEGTFTYATGLRPFKLGAFKLAVDTGLAICPIALQGTRKFQRGNNFWLSLTRIKIKISKPILPETSDWSEVMRLHKLVRSEIAKYCGEGSIDLVTAGIQKPEET